MATIQMAWNRGETLDAGGAGGVAEATGGSAPTDTVEVNIANGARKEEVLIALDLIRDKVVQSVNFA